MSRVLKPSFYVPVDDIKLIKMTPPVPKPGPESQPGPHSAGLPENVRLELEEAMQLKQSILRDAEEAAESLIQLANEEARAIREQAQAEIEAWWNERRQQDEQMLQQARQQGYEAGYAEGKAQAEREVEQASKGMLEEAQSVLKQAYESKRQIIGEAEPFLVELACAIAAKVIGRELEQSPETVLEMTRTVLSRWREKGSVTLCVSPEQYPFIRDARDELQGVIDPQADLRILPDASIDRFGCVVRTEYGSMDARIDTQLKEIKAALQMLATGSEDSADEQ